MDTDYKGLSNIGATCYMNSLLQTLYMTPEFRQAIYEWKYNERVHPKPEDSILYQLQRLFGKLDRKFPGEISTRDLVKSFQWHDQQAQLQQDIQQFNRVLFQALQKSLKSKKQTQQSANHFVRDLYEGQMIHYTHCKQCENQSQREQTFQDLILTVKNPFQKLGLQRYMKPEILDQDNLYKCEICQKLVPAERGVRFLKMPKLLNIILRRFDFDYFTFQRIKLNDRVQFPHVLNMNNYMQGYSNIQNKLDQDSSTYFINKQVPSKQPPTFSTTNKKVVTKKPGAPSIAGKITTKPSSNTKSFLTEMRKKKMQSQQQNEDLFYVSGTAEVHKQPETKKQENLIKSENFQKPQIKIQAAQQHSQAIIPKEQQYTPKNESLAKPNITQEMKPPLPPILPLIDLTPPPISQPYARIPQNSTLTAEQQLQIKLAQKNKLQKQKQIKLQQYEKACKQKIKQYLKQGNLVYQLYSVLIHNGSANHGHYYSYIKSFQNNHWYCFNDDRVTQINVQEIQKTYGGAGHSNAYALYYRQVSNNTQTNTQQFKKICYIPPYIQHTIDQQITNLRRRQKQKIQNLQNILILKLYYQLSVKMLEINKSSTLQLCLLKVRQIFDIPTQILLHNTRLRLFNPLSETKLQTYTSKQKCTLQQLKISSYKNLMLQIKKQNEIFQQYVVGKMNIRIVLWQQCKNNIKSLDQSFLTLHKIGINRGSIMRDIQQVIKDKRKQILNLSQKQGQNQICIVKRHQNDEYSYHQIINVFDYKQKNIDQLMIQQNQILFIEPDSNQLMWPIQFQNQIYRITIKYVNGQTGHIQSYLTDSRKIIAQLKNQLCALLKFQQNDTIIKRGNKSGMELKNLSTTMKDARFISGTQVYLQKGLPAKPGQVRIQLFIASDAANECYNRLHQFQFIADVPINGQCKASQIKQLFTVVLKKYKNLQIKSNQFRIREKVCDKIGKIYRERPMKQQQLIQKRQISIQFKPQNVDDKDYLTYVRVWDQQTWTLSKKLQIIVTRTTNMKDFAAIIAKQNSQVPIQQMQICRILSINKFNILDLCQMEYFQMTQAPVISQPLFINADGLLFIIKSTKKQPRNLTKQQQTKFGGNIKTINKTIKGRQNTNNIKKQKGVTIKVIQNIQENQQEGDQNQGK